MPSHIPYSAGMDRQLDKQKSFSKLLVTILSGVVLLVCTYFYFSNWFGGRTLHLSANRLSISKITLGVFEDYIPVRARVAPYKTVFLDAVQGGRIESIFIEEGAQVKAGQTLLKLSNSDLQLSVMSTESRVMEQLNYMKDQEMRFEQNRLNYKRSLIEFNHGIRQLQRELPRKKKLYEQSLISKAEYEDFVDNLNYQIDQRLITLESQESNERLMMSQLKFFKTKSLRMEENLSYARKSLDELEVKSPVSGKISGFDVEIGQNVTQGMRIGQVSDPSVFKMVGHIDEFYLNRVSLGKKATFEHEQTLYEMEIVKIYPNVTNGQFEVDFHFINTFPKSLHHGQTIQSKLLLGNNTNALLVPNGQFFQDTGGRWIYVLNNEGTEAYKREIVLGQRNTRFIEIVSGLTIDEQVITSSYAGFKDMDKLKLNK